MKGRTKLNTGRLIQARAREATKRNSGSTGYGEAMLKLAKIEHVNYEEMLVKVKIIGGESDLFSVQTPIPLTWPGAGQRHFLGSMPEVGNYCLVGWTSAESSGMASSRVPVILTWFAAPPWMGHDWVPGQEFEAGEGQDTPLQRGNLNGMAQRTRFKLRHMRPGAVTASSSHGSDLELTESVLISNRRGNTIEIRDQDQAIVSQSVAAFHVTSGVRVYSGPVQRTASFLPTQMVSDGLYWDTPQQISLVTGFPVTQDELSLHSGFPETGAIDDTIGYQWPPGFLTPGAIFQRIPGARASLFALEAGSVPLPVSTDPFNFLRWGSLVTARGTALPGTEPDAVYGGKVLYRVAATPLGIPGRVVNAFVEEEDTEEIPDALTEYRVEVTHLSDGTLPVTEETDGFDADRLPQEAPSSNNPRAGSPNAAFLEFVIGSVVGNDRSTTEGLRQYGIPLAPVVFGGGAPGLGSALDTEIGSHAATLTRVRPVVGDHSASWGSWTKDGRYLAHVVGPSGLPSLELLLANGMRLRSEGPMVIDAAGGWEFSTGENGPSGYGVALKSENGAVHIYGGGPTTAGSQARRAEGTEDKAPDLTLEARRNLLITSQQRVDVKASQVHISNASEVVVEALQSVRISAGDAIQTTTKMRDEVTTGKSTQLFTGPKDGLATNGSVRRIDIVANPATGFFGGTVDEYFNLYGDRTETFAFGNHTTSCVVGDLSYETSAGSVTHRAGLNQVQVGMAGVDIDATVGNVSVNAPAGAFTASTSVSATVRTQGTATLSGAASLYLGGPGKVGPIVSGADLDPLTGIPLVVLGLGSPGHNIGTPV